MRTRTWAALALGLCLAVSVRADDATKKDHEKFQGTWTVVSAELNGEKLDEAITKGLKFIVKGDKFDVEGPEEVKKEYAKGTFKMEAGTTPKTIDIKVGEGDMKGETKEGIYELDGDNMKLCAKMVGKDRPSEFATKAGSEMVLLVLKREKP